MIRKTVLAAAALLVMASASTIAGEALLCSLSSIQVCTADGCEWRTAEDLNIPAFVIFDLEASAILAVGEDHAGRESAFTVVDNEEGRLVFQGYENQRAWSAVITDQSELVLTASSADGAFAVHGACFDTGELEQ